jgi:hypothetical protein
MMPAKALKASAALIMLTPADDAAWVAKYQVVMERLKAKEAIIKAGAGNEGGTRVGDTAQRSESVEAAPGATGVGRSVGDGQEPRSTTRTLETVEAREAATSARDAGQAGAEQTRNVVETPWDVGKEEEPQQHQQQRQEERPSQPQLEAEQHELGQLEGPVGEAEREAAVLPPDAQAEALASQFRPQGRCRP